jgi:hypothetical protein
MRLGTSSTRHLGSRIAYLAVDARVGQLSSDDCTVQVSHVNTGVSHLELCGPYTRVHCLNSPPHLVATKTDTESAMAR